MSTLITAIVLALLFQWGTAQQVCTPFMPCTSTTSLPQVCPLVGSISYTMTLSGFINPIPSTSVISLTTFFDHTYVGDLFLTLTSPSGVSITLLSRNGGSRNNAFNGTVFIDTATSKPSGYSFDILPAASLKPQDGHFSDFIGTNPNGVWNLTFLDVAELDAGVLLGFILNIPDVSGCDADYNYGHANWPQTLVGSAAIGSCGTGYYGTPKRNCLAGGVWSTSISQACTRYACKGYMDTTTTWKSVSAPGSTLGTCNPGYLGTPARDCDALGHWQTPTGYPCISALTVCPATNYGSAQYPDTYIGQKGAGQCNDGYVGEPYLLCQLDGTWSPDTIFPCKKLPGTR